MRQIGFSTGAIARCDFRKALAQLRQHGVQAIELSALRIGELVPLKHALRSLDLDEFSFVSIHAPSSFEPSLEAWVTTELQTFAEMNLPVIIHPDVIRQPKLWRSLGTTLVVENMDKRKHIGRTVQELAPVFEALPAARFCFDIGHARQVDPSMTEAAMLLQAYRDRLVEVHMSEVNTASRHDPISLNAVAAFGSVANAIPEDVPIILESLIDEGQSDIDTEIQRALAVFTPVAV